MDYQDSTMNGGYGAPQQQWGGAGGMTGGYGQQQGGNGGGGYGGRTFNAGGGRSYGGGQQGGYAGGQGGGYRGGQEGGYRGGQGGEGGNSETRTRIHIPSNSVGRVIGRGGARIQDIQAKSGARVRVSKDNRYGPSTAVDIFGDVDCRREAERLIQEVVAEPPQIETQ